MSLITGRGPRRIYEFSAVIEDEHSIGKAILAFIRSFMGVGADARRVYLRNAVQTVEMVPPADGKVRRYDIDGKLDWGDTRLALSTRDESSNDFIAEVVDAITQSGTLLGGLFRVRRSYTHPRSQTGGGPTPSISVVRNAEVFYVFSTELAQIPNAGINGPGGAGFLAVTVIPGVTVYSWGPSDMAPTGAFWSVRAALNVTCANGLPGPDAVCADQASGADRILAIKVVANPDNCPGTGIHKAPWKVQIGTISMGSPCGQPCSIPPRTFPQCAHWNGGTGPTVAESEVVDTSTFTQLGMNYDQGADVLSWLFKRDATVILKHRINYTGSWEVKTAGCPSCCQAGVFCGNCAGSWCDCGHAAWCGGGGVPTCGGGVACSITNRDTLTPSGSGGGAVEWNMPFTGLKITENGVVTRDDLAGKSIILVGGIPVLDPPVATAGRSGGFVRAWSTDAPCGGAECNTSFSVERSLQIHGYGRPGGFAVVTFENPTSRYILHTDSGSALLPLLFTFDGKITQAGQRYWLFGQAFSDPPFDIKRTASTDLSAGDFEDWTNVVLPDAEVCDDVRLFDSLKSLTGKGAVVVGVHTKFQPPDCGISLPSDEGRLYAFNQPSSVKSVAIHGRDKDLRLRNDPSWFNVENNGGWPKYRWRVLGL